MTPESLDAPKPSWTIGAILRYIASRGMALLRSDSGLGSAVQTVLRGGIILCLNFATGILTARFLGPSGRGELAAIIVWPQLFGWSFSLGLPSSLIYNVKATPEHRGRIVSTGILLSFAGGCVAGGIGALVVPLWLHRYDPSVVHLAQLAMLVAPLGLMSTLIGAALQAADRFGQYNRVMSLAPVTTLVMLLGLLAAGHFTSKAAALCYLLPIVPVLIYGFIQLRRTYAPKLEFHPPTAKLLLSYGTRVWAADMMRMMSDQIERAILTGLLLPSSLGIYVVAQSLAQPLKLVHESVSLVLFPKAAGRSVDEAKRLAGLTIRVNVAITATATLVLSVAAPMLLRLFYGPGFVEAAGPFRILACETILFAVNWHSVQVFIAVGRPGLITLIEALGMALFVPMVFVLVPIMGAQGAALAWLANSALRLSAVYICFPLVLKTRPPWPFLGKADLVEIAGRLRRA